MTTAQATPTATLRAMFASIDSGDVPGAAALIADDVHFRFGNADATDSKASFVATLETVRGSISAIRHDILDIWQVEDDAVIAVMDVQYTRLDGSEVTLPCCNFVRLRDGLIQDYRVYIDIAPVLAP